MTRGEFAALLALAGCGVVASGVYRNGWVLFAAWVVVWLWTFSPALRFVLLPRHRWCRCVELWSWSGTWGGRLCEEGCRAQWT